MVYGMKCPPLIQLLHIYSTTAADVEERIKKKVKDVLPCDVTKPGLLLPDDVGQFDVVTTELTLDTACRTFDAYSEAVKRISQLIRPGGRFISVVVFDTTYYIVGGKAFFGLPITNDFVEDVLQVNGFEDLSYETTSCMHDGGVLNICAYQAIKRGC